MTTPRLPVPLAHDLDRACMSGSCDQCRQNIALITLHELRTLNDMLRPLAQMAGSRLGLMRGLLPR